MRHTPRSFPESDNTPTAHHESVDTDDGVTHGTAHGVPRPSGAPLATVLALAIPPLVALVATLSAALVAVGVVGLAVLLA